ncbi:adenylate kinase family protein [Thermosphaera chiliense]|uniref:Putative adenylate kinase n=1 Tax=Thermosphaera chiliense TaxID=3402707 RepID=A0A7M1UR33_9CREN|nr:adenylate kinase family protein [Thermosphaera aggregans]QOR94439.1 adenylate kinase family protein [Thermosphaera aggregans]
MGKAIIIAGVPGTGKSSLARELARVLGTEAIDLSRFAIDNGLILEYDASRKTYVIDEEAVASRIKRIVENRDGYVIIDTHYPEIIDPGIVDKVVVLRLNPLELEKRLLDRGWGREKVNENVMAEILGTVSVNALEAFGENKIYELDVSGKSIDVVLGEALAVVRGEAGFEPGLRINWLEQIPVEALERFEKYGGDSDGF